MARYYVDEANDKIVRTDLCFVRLEKANGETIEALEPKRLFPFSRQNEYISLISDSKKEVAVIRDLSRLSADSQKAVEECFTEIYLIPKITRVQKCEYRFGTLNIDAQTDRGHISFRIRNANSDIKHLPDGRMLFRDSNDNRYVIQDIDAMDKHSLHCLYPYI